MFPNNMYVKPIPTLIKIDMFATFDDKKSQWRSHQKKITEDRYHIRGKIVKPEVYDNFLRHNGMDKNALSEEDRQLIDIFVDNLDESV